MLELDEIKRQLVQYPVLALDLETKAPEGRPPEEALETNKAQLYLVALAAGHGASMKSYALPPTAEVLAFVQDCLRRKHLRITGHNLINYDMEVLHYQKVIPFNEIQARLIDTLPLVWLLDEAKSTDRGLKASAKRYIGVNMTTFDEAFVSSPNALEIQRLRHAQVAIRKTAEQQLKLLRRDRIQEKKRLILLLQEKFKDKHDQLSRAQKAGYKIKIQRYLDSTFGESAAQNIKSMVETECAKLNERIAQLDKAWEADKKTYAADDARRSLQLYGRVRHIISRKNLVDWADVELKNKIACSSMQLAGMHVDVDRLDQLDKEFIPLESELEARLYDMAKCDFNPRSSKQLNELLFETLGIPPVKETVKEKNPVTGEFEYVVKEVRNTNEKTLARIDHPFVQALLNYRAIYKLHSTYVVALRQRALEDPEWRIHCIFNSTGTVTGRYSSSNPNLQNIPSRSKPNEYDERVQELGPRIRWTFNAPPGKKLVCADLSQIELRLIAQVTGDDRMLKIYNDVISIDGIHYFTGDIHANTERALGIPRKLAKNLNFGLCYGMGAAKFARYARLFKPGTREWDIESAKKYRAQFLEELYEGILSTIEQIQEAIDGVGRRHPARNFRLLTGRYRHFKKGENVYGGKAFNSVIQGSAADLLKIIMCYIYSAIVMRPEFEGTKLVLQVHDEVGLEVPEDLAPAVGILVKYIMERPWFHLDVPVLASVKVCDDWSGKDDDDIPEVGKFYAKTKDGDKETERVYTSDDWHEFVEFEAAAKKDKTKTKQVLSKSAVAMLTPEQEAWAAQFVPEVPCYSV